MKKTITLGHDQDNPNVSLCIGHVTATEFNKAFKAEGWCGFDWIHKADIKHDHWKKLKRGWKRVPPENKKAVAVTVMEW